MIAIENVRLFQELEARNSELTEALEQQTATSEILRVISQSPTDVQPVFDAIASGPSALRREVSVVARFDGNCFIWPRLTASPAEAWKQCGQCSRCGRTRRP